MKKLAIILFTIFCTLLAVVLYGYFINDIYEVDESPNVVSYNDGSCKKDDCLILINNKNVLSEDIPNEHLMKLNNGEFINKIIYEDLQEMLNEARNHGLKPTVNSGYRSIKGQTELFKKYYDSYKEDGFTKEEALIQAENMANKPGTSEHQIGIAVDIISTDKNSEDLYGWLADNSYKYGFILRYPINKEEVTGLNFEPWHYRYVGKENALKIYESKQTLEEYLE